MRNFLRRPVVWGALGYIGVVIVLFRRAILPPAGWMLSGDDIHRAYYFFREFFNHWMHLGVFPWWNPYLFGGMPFIADPIVNIWYPVNWLFFVLPLNIAYSWHIAFHLVWAGLGMAGLSSSFMVHGLQEERGQVNFAAWVSGLVFMCSGFFMARTWSGHVDVIAAASWIPWVVGAFEQVLRPERANEKKYIVIAAVFFALQLLSGYQTMAFMTGIIVGIMALVHMGIKRRWQPIVYALGAGFLGVGLAAFHIIPVQEFFRLSIRTYTLPYSWISFGSWTIQSLVLLINPYFFGDQRSYTGPPPNFWEHSAYIGVAGLILALIGILSLVRVVWGRKGNRARHTVFGMLCVVCVIVGVWMSLGPNAPIDLQYIAWKYVLMYRYLRIPPRHLILVVFGLSGLAGLGLQYIVVHFKSARWAVWGIGTVTLIEMVLFGQHFIEMQPIPETRHDVALIKRLTQDAEPYRLLQDFGVWLPQRDALDFDSVMQYRIFSMTGYSPSIYRPYYEYIARQLGMKGEWAMRSYDVQVPYLSAKNADSIDFLNVKYILVPQEYDPVDNNPRYKPVLDDDVKQYRLYENTTVLPRFYLRERGCGSVAVRSYTPNKIVLSVHSTCDTMLMSSEVWYPGWEAYIDGKKTRIDKTDDAFRTLFISSGNHSVVYQYNPRIFVIGGGISLVILVLLVLWFRKGTTSVRRASI